MKNKSTITKIELLQQSNNEYVDALLQKLQKTTHYTIITIIIFYNFTKVHDKTLMALSRVPFTKQMYIKFQLNQ